MRKLILATAAVLLTGGLMTSAQALPVGQPLKSIDTTAPTVLTGMVHQARWWRGRYYRDYGWRRRHWRR